MATLASPAARRRSDRLFYTGMSAAIALLVFLGFSRSYYLSHWFDPPKGTPEIGLLLHIHGLVFTAWILLSVVQPALIAGRNPALHRSMGYFGAGLAALMVILGNLAAVAGMHGGFIGMGDPHAFYAIPFFAINTFAVIVAMAVIRRDRAETHKRLILLSGTQIVEAAVARIPVDVIIANAPISFFVGSNFIIAAGIAHDLASRGRIHPVWIWGGLAVVASQAVRMAIAETGPWLAFARAMAALWPA